jgi:hypothetical protein
MNKAGEVDFEAILTLKDRTDVGIHILNEVVNGKDHDNIRNFALGMFDVEVRLAIYWALNDKYLTMEGGNAVVLEALNAPWVTTSLTDFKGKASQKLINAATNVLFDGVFDRLMRMGDVSFGSPTRREQERERANKLMDKQRVNFNAQHAPAPEGTVKELAARFGKSIGEIRRLKAAGELHTLTETVAQA